MIFTDLYLHLLIALAAAVAFYRAASYERMSTAVWVIASIGLSLAVMLFWPRVMLLVLVQVGLFGVMWWYNVRRAPRP